MTGTHTLGFPRIGESRELKRAVEAYWRGDMDRQGLEQAGRELRRRAWERQARAAMDFVTVGDFSWYDHVLDTAAMLGVVPPRFGHDGGPVDLDTVFRMARGRAPTGPDASPCAMTKWFDTNYHFIVPELQPAQRFGIHTESLFDQVEEAHALGHRAKPVLVGPLTFLGLAHCAPGLTDPLSLLPPLVDTYRQVLERLAAQGVEWVQIDEPILVTDLNERWREAYGTAYEQLAAAPVRILLATYFGGLRDNLDTALGLPTAGLHIDAVRAPDQLYDLLEHWPAERVLSLGIVDGRNVWRTDPDSALKKAELAAQLIGRERLWLAPSCSLLHVPLDLELETGLEPELRSWLAFAVQKLEELETFRRAVDSGRDAAQGQLEQARKARRRRLTAAGSRRSAVRDRMALVDDNATRRRSPYPQRAAAQRRRLALPLFPTTTIGSFPQTAEIRALRRDHRGGRLTTNDYEAAMRSQIAQSVREQERLGLDVLVHGEPERNDMVEYFGGQLRGFAVTDHAWVQSYGSRCVKPPIIHGDVDRPRPMTVKWFRYAQTLTRRPVKGMLTGPVTLLQWSFVRDDQPRAETCRQIALALREETVDLQRAGAGIVQVDEPALREGMPLRRADRAGYLDWATQCFRLATAGVDDATQIHTHMCYSDFADIIDAVRTLDADVVTIETARSGDALLAAFEGIDYPNELGPGLFDIHSPRPPEVAEMTQRLARAAVVLPAERLWANPDCGLKTRNWEEVRLALSRMVEAAGHLRAHFGKSAAPPSGKDRARVAGRG